MVTEMVQEFVKNYDSVLKMVTGVISGRYRNVPGVDKQDLIQEGLLGALCAYKRHDKNMGEISKSYIRCYIIRYIHKAVLEHIEQASNIKACDEDTLEEECTAHTQDDYENFIIKYQREALRMVDKYISNQTIRDVLRMKLHGKNNKEIMDNHPELSYTKLKRLEKTGISILKKAFKLQGGGV